jgi:hypothetical protein
MLYRATFYANGVQTRLLLLDATERSSCLVTVAKRSPTSSRHVLDCEEDANDT